MESEQVRSLTLAFLMIGSVLLGLFFLGVETDVSDQPPFIDGEEPGDFLIGEVSTITVTISDESTDDIYLEVSLNNAKLPDVHLDENGKFVVDITGLNAGEHSLNVLARDFLNQETRWYTQFTISYPGEGVTVIVLDDFETNIEYGEDAILSGNLSHTSIQSCEFVWSDSDIDESKLNVPVNENGYFFIQFSELEENLTISMEANCGINIYTTDRVAVTYVVEKSVNSDENSSTEENNDNE